jgi:VWFA-related protein
VKKRWANRIPKSGIIVNILKRTICYVLTCFLLFAEIATAQKKQEKAEDKDQAIQLKAELVELRVVVTDKKGNLIDNLKQEDFEVIEDGRPQDISFFSVERIGGSNKVASSPDAPVEPVKRTSTESATPARTIVLFVDTLHLSPSSMVEVKKTLRQFVDKQITDQDVVALITPYGNSALLQQFAKDRRILKYAIEKLSRFPRTETFFTPYLASRVLNEEQEAIQVATNILAAEEGFQALTPEMAKSYSMSRARQILLQELNMRKATLLTLKAVVERLAEMPGQRLIVTMSDGFSLADEGTGSDTSDMQKVISRASRSGVVIYSIGAKGLSAPAEYSARPVPSGIEFSNFMALSENDQQIAMRAIAAETGGEVYFNNNRLEVPLKKVIDNNRIYYALAYYPQNEKNKTKFRKVSIKLKNHPDYEVRTQKGYTPIEEEKVIEPKTPREKLFYSMIQPLAVASIPVTASADFLAYEGDDSQVTVQVHFDAKPLEFKEEDGKYRFNCDLAVVAFDSSAKIVHSFAQQIKGEMRAEHLEQAKKNGFRYSTRLKLKPGLHQLRIGVRDTGSELTGTAMAWVDVPDLKKGRIALSSLFLGRDQKSEEKEQVVGTSDKKSEGPKLLLGRSAFKSGERAYYRFVAYNTSKNDELSEGATVKVDIYSDEKSVFEGQWNPLESRTIRRDKIGVELGGEVVLALRPGIYELRVTVKGGKSKNTVQQIATIEIES